MDERPEPRPSERSSLTAKPSASTPGRSGSGPQQQEPPQHRQPERLSQTPQQGLAQATESSKRQPQSRAATPAQPSGRRPSAQHRQSGSRYSTESALSYASSIVDDDDDDDASTAAPAQTIRDVSRAFRTGRPSPYHMAVVTLIGSLASGMPLASMFKVYTYVMCEVYDPSIRKQSAAGPALRSWSMALSASLFGVPAVPGVEDEVGAAVKLPQAPELPNPPQCSTPWVQKSASTYSAAMITVGALLGLMILSRASKLSRRFGRKPLLLLTHLFLALALLVFRVAVLLPPYAAAVFLYLAVVLSEASAGAPLRIALQNYVVDTTTEAQRAGALSFIEGFGQIGAFPSSALGGLLASLSGEFFAPFYANIALMLVASAYILVLVPESKQKHEHTLIDDWAHFDDDVEAGQSESSEDGHADQLQGQQGQGSAHDEGPRSPSPRRRPDDGAHGGTNPSRSSVHTWSTSHSALDDSKFSWRSKLRALNFLRPLSIFRPTTRHYSDVTAHDALAAPPSAPGEDGEAGQGDEHAASTAIKRIQKRVDFRLFNLAFVVVFEETYQCFLVPLLLLYNSEKFGFDVLQNGYLISILQSSRALFLTAIFPPSMALARRYVAKKALAKRKEKIRRMKAEAKRKKQRRAQSRPPPNPSQGGNDEETQPLVSTRDASGRSINNLGSSSRESQYGTMTSRDYGLSERTDGKATAGTGASDAAEDHEPRPGRRRPSYHAAASLGFANMRRRASSHNRLQPSGSRITIESDWETHSIFTNPPSELIKKIQRGKLDIGIMLFSYLLACFSFVMLASSTYAPSASPKPSSGSMDPTTDVDALSSVRTFWKSPWIPLTIAVVGLQLASGSTSLRTALVVNAMAEDDQTKALAAHQILCTSVNAVMPLLTSLVYGVALERGRPELVWLFKALFAAFSAVGALGLFWSHRGFYEKAHEEEEEGEEGEEDEEEEEGEEGEEDEEEEDEAEERAGIEGAQTDEHDDGDRGGTDGHDTPADGQGRQHKG